jgi:hypothetical protein
LGQTRNAPTSITLPTTLDEFESLVTSLLDGFHESVDRDLITAVVANRIMHLPVTEASVSADYFRNCVIKSMAYGLAAEKSTKLAHKRQIEQLDQLLKDNPHDQQALDALQKAAEDGSEIAKEILAKYTPGEDSQLALVTA